ncbi:MULTISPECIES: hypothetical protein [unclassified Pseudoalteromonas]|nr:MULTISPECIES: hypothetical protein [unclassified Pseudoalteromonas]
MKTLINLELKAVTGGYFIVHADNPIAFANYHGYPMPEYLRRALK